MPVRLERWSSSASESGCEAGPAGSAGGRFLAELERHTKQTRELFLRLLARERSG